MDSDFSRENPPRADPSATYGGASRSSNASVGASTAFKEDSPYCNRVITVRLNPSDEDRALVREIARDYQNYCNFQARADIADHLGERPPLDAQEGETNVEYVRRTRKGKLSGAVYRAAEHAQVRPALGRKDENGVTARRRAMAGGPLPQFKAGVIRLSSSSTKDKVKPAAFVLRTQEGGFLVRLNLMGNSHSRGCWVIIPVMFRTYRDRIARPALEEMASGAMPIRSATVLCERADGKILLQIAERRKVPKALKAAAVATLSTDVVDESESLAQLHLRVPGARLDLTGYLHEFLQFKEHLASMRRRLCIQIGNGRGAVRKKRRLLKNLTIENKSRTHWQKVAKKVVVFAVANGCSKVRILDLIPRMWPTDDFVFYLRSAAEMAGLAVEKVKEGASADETTERAARAALKRQQRAEREIDKAVERLARLAQSASLGPADLASLIDARVQKITYQSQGV